MNKIPLFIFTSILFVLQSPAYSEGSAASSASVDLSSQGMAKIISGNIDLSAAGGQLSVASVEMVGDIAYISLKASESVVRTTIAVSNLALGHSLVAVGQGVQASATAAGQLLSVAGKIFAFIPNELGKSLIYSQIV